MKTLRISIGAALLVPLTLFAQNAPSPPAPMVGVGPAAETTVRRVDQRELASAFTARDLIGKAVVNYAGERLGTINDVALSPSWEKRFGTVAGDDPGSAAAPASESGEAPRPEAATRGDSEQRVFVSTGGVLGLGGRFGMGADWVSVPADQLLYDRNQDRFILNLTPARFALVAQPRAQPDEAAVTAADAPGASVGPDAGLRDGEGGNPPDVRRIADALRQDPELRGRSRIEVFHTGDAIKLTGQVDEPGLIRRAGDVAREHTSLEVRNLVGVSGQTIAE